MWLTEWACPNPSGPASLTWQFMAAALRALDGDQWVEAYAWFAVSDDAFQWLVRSRGAGVPRPPG